MAHINCISMKENMHIKLVTTTKRSLLLDGEGQWEAGTDSCGRDRGVVTELDSGYIIGMGCISGSRRYDLPKWKLGASVRSSGDRCWWTKSRNFPSLLPFVVSCNFLCWTFIFPSVSFSGLGTVSPASFPSSKA